jgi:hypothetical protein
MELTVASEARRSLAARIAPVYAANPKVAAILLAGSSARGDADRFSDIELGVFWREAPSDDERRIAIERVGGDLHRLYEYEPGEGVWADDWKIGRDQQNRPFSGISVDMIHMRVATVDQTIAAVLRDFDPDPSKQNLIAAIRMGICLHGEHLMARWRSETGVYPVQLKNSVVRRFGQIDHFWRLAMWRARGDLTGVHGKIVATHGAILQVLAAINGIYSYGFKHRETLIAQFAIAPANLRERLDASFSADHVAGEAALRALVEEMYDLIERHVPDVDVQRLRKIFEYRRPLWDEAPPV